MHKYTSIKSILIIICLFVSASIISCGGSSAISTSATSSSSVVTSNFPSEFAVASPTASTSGSSSINALVDDDLMYATITSGSAYIDKSAIYSTILAAGSAIACQVTLPALSGSTDPSCYGPSLDYCDHPDFIGTTDADCTDADAPGTPNDTDGDGQLPTGDLGIWVSNATGSEACSAAKVNSLLQDTGDMADYIMLMTASMNCLATRSGATWPSSDGDVLTLTSELDTAIKVNNPLVTVTTATVTNLPDVTDGGTSYDAQQFYVVVTDTRSGSSVIVDGYMNHMTISASSTTYKGRIWAEISGASGAGNKNAFSLTYHRESSTSLKYKLLSADYQSASATAVIFDGTSGNIDIAGDWTGNMAQAIININPATGLGDFSYAWSAGTGAGSPENARIFNGYTNATSGCAFFGYGTGFDNVAGTASDNVIDGFICNWAGPGNDHSKIDDAVSIGGSKDLAQKQCMTVNSTTGLFEVDVTKENITYAPTVSCDSTTALGTKLPSSTSSTWSTSAISNDLVPLTGDTEFGFYTAPTAPSMPTGL